jgi:hypothetical protein
MIGAHRRGRAVTVRGLMEAADLVITGDCPDAGRGRDGRRAWRSPPGIAVVGSAADATGCGPVLLRGETVLPGFGDALPPDHRRSLPPVYDAPWDRDAYVAHIRAYAAAHADEPLGRLGDAGFRRRRHATT